MELINLKEYGLPGIFDFPMGPLQATDEDIECLNELGVEGIREKGYWGTAHRLANSGDITREQSYPPIYK